MIWPALHVQLLDSYQHTLLTTYKPSLWLTVTCYGWMYVFYINDRLPIADFVNMSIKAIVAKPAELPRGFKKGFTDVYTYEGCTITVTLQNYVNSNIIELVMIEYQAYFCITIMK